MSRGAANAAISLSVDLELDRIVSVAKAAELTTLSVDTLRRRHADKIRKLSPRRAGMRLRDVLTLGVEPTAA
jgi:hypothetical protein